MSARERLRRAGAVTACMTVAMLGGALPAGAADGWQSTTRHDWVNGSYWCIDGPDDRSFGCFEQNGDWIQVGDNKADGRRAGVEWRTSDGRRGVCVHTAGKYSEKHNFSSYIGWQACNKDFAESATVSIRAGSCDAGARSCTVVGNWQWSPWQSYKAG